MKNTLSRLPNVFQNREDEPNEWQRHLRSIQKERKNGRSDAYHLGMMGIQTLPLLEQKLDAFLDRTKTSAETDLSVISKALETQLENVESEIDDNPLGSQISKSYHGDRFAVKDFAISLLESSITRREQRLAGYRLSELDVIEKLGTFKSKEAATSIGIWSKPAGKILLSMIVGIGELLILTPILEASGTWGNTIELYLFSAVLVCLLTVSTHISAQFFADRNPALAILSILAGLLLIAALALIRWNDANALIYLMINVSFFLLGTLIAYHAHKSSTYADLLARKKSLEKRIIRTGRAIGRLKGLRDGILKVSQRRAIRRGLLKNEELSRKKLKINEMRAKIEAKSETLDAIFQSMRTEASYDFRLSYASGRRDRWFSLAVIIIVSLVMFNCQSVANDEYRDIFLVFDASTSNNVGEKPSPAAVFAKIDEILELDRRRNGRYGINLYLGSLGESKIPKIRKIVLAPGEPYFLRTENKRVAEIKAFGDSVQAAIKEALAKASRDRMTRANAGLCYFMQAMLQTQSDKLVKRNVILISDMTEASPVYTFPSSGASPSFTKSYYAKISRLMKSDCEMPRLDNVSFEICHQPKVQLEDQFLAATAFWKAYLLDHGATDVKVSTSI